VVVLSTTLPKPIDPAEKEVGVTPTPLNGNVSGLFDALVIAVSKDGAIDPSAVGVTVIRMEQLELAPRVDPQVIEEME
jgi:hypothetical protein